MIYINPVKFIWIYPISMNSSEKYSDKALIDSMNHGLEEEFPLLPDRENSNSVNISNFYKSVYENSLTNVIRKDFQSRNVFEHFRKFDEIRIGNISGFFSGVGKRLSDVSFPKAKNNLAEKFTAINEILYREVNSPSLLFTKGFNSSTVLEKENSSTTVDSLYFPNVNKNFSNESLLNNFTENYGNSLVTKASENMINSFFSNYSLLSGMGKVINAGQKNSYANILRETNSFKNFSYAGDFTRDYFRESYNQLSGENNFTRDIWESSYDEKNLSKENPVNISVNLGGITQQISSKEDADYFIHNLALALSEALTSSAKGVY